MRPIPHPVFLPSSLYAPMPVESLEQDEPLPDAPAPQLPARRQRAATATPRIGPSPEPAEPGKDLATLQPGGAANVGPYSSPSYVTPSPSHAALPETRLAPSRHTRRQDRDRAITSQPILPEPAVSSGSIPSGDRTQTGSREPSSSAAARHGASAEISQEYTPIDQSQWATPSAVDQAAPSGADVDRSTSRAPDAPPGRPIGPSRELLQTSAQTAAETPTVDVAPTAAGGSTERRAGISSEGMGLPVHSTTAAGAAVMSEVQTSPGMPPTMERHEAVVAPAMVSTAMTRAERRASARTPESMMTSRHSALHSQPSYPSEARPTVKVSIGRIEVRAVMPQPAPPPVRSAPPGPKISLGEYLQREYRRGSR